MPPDIWVIMSLRQLNKNPDKRKQTNDKGSKHI